MGKWGEKKGQFWAISYFWIEVFLNEVLGLQGYEGTTFMPTFCVKARLHVNFIAVRKYTFSIPFFLFCVQNLCSNDSEYHSLNWKDVSITDVDIFEKKQFSLHFLELVMGFKM